MSDWIDFSPEPIENRKGDPFFDRTPLTRLRPLTPFAIVVGAVLTAAAGVLWM